MLTIKLRRRIIKNQKFIEYLRITKGITVNVSLIKVKLNRKRRRIIKLNVNGGITRRS